MQPGELPRGAQEHPLDTVDAREHHPERRPAGAALPLHVPGTALRPPRAAVREEENREPVLPQRWLCSV